VWSSVQRFQAGEDGDGVSLVAKADRAGGPDYARAVRLFVAEERNHACLVVAADHGPALHHLGLGRQRFVADVMASSRTVVSAILTPRTAAQKDTRPGTRSGTA
jgi:hypothetical protein